MGNSVIGGNVLIFGDLHFSDTFTGKHTNYLENCFWVLGKMNEMVEKYKPSAVVLLGDIVGWRDTNIRNREVLSVLCKTLRSWQQYGRVFALRGNHDLGGYPEFNFLSDLGLIESAQELGGYFDYYGYEGEPVPEVRFNMVDYGNEYNHIEVAGGGASNVVLGHNNYTIEGVTNWYQEHAGIELNRLQNFDGVDMVISGHIHTPSPDIVQTDMPDGKSCQLFYPGCPTRPVKDRNMYDKCWAVLIYYDPNKGSTDVSMLDFNLRPASEIFFADDDFVDEQDEEQLQEQIRMDALKDVLSDLLKYRMNQGDLLSQIDNIPNASQEAKDVAKKYLQEALNNG